MELHVLLHEFWLALDHAVGGDGGVCGEAAGVRVVSVHVARAGRVAGFDVEESRRAGDLRTGSSL